jgi:phosphatidylserine decarboxylase
MHHWIKQVKIMREITTKLKDKHGNDIIVVQIAGLIARRIVCETDNGPRAKPRG